MEHMHLPAMANLSDNSCHHSWVYTNAADYINFGVYQHLNLWGVLLSL